jgi:hypothetical protein
MLQTLDTLLRFDWRGIGTLGGMSALRKLVFLCTDFSKRIELPGVNLCSFEPRGTKAGRRISA